MDDRSGSSRIDAPAQTRSPSRNSCPAAEHVAGAGVRQHVDHAACRGLQLQVLEALLGAPQVEQRLLALLPLGGHVRLGPGLVRLDLLRELEQLLIRVEHDELRLLVLDPGNGVSLGHVELGALQVVLRPHQRGLVLLVRDARLGRGLLDLGVGLLQLRLLLLDGPEERGPVELDDDVPRLHDRAALHDLDDLQLAGIHRRGEHDRLERPDLAADFQRVDELPLRDLRGRQVGQRPAARGDEHADDRDGDDDARDHDVARPSDDFRQAFHHDPAWLPTFRATTAPSSRPAVITASWAFVTPIVTGRSSKSSPRLTRTNARSPS